MILVKMRKTGETTQFLGSWARWAMSWEVERRARSAEEAEGEVCEMMFLYEHCTKDASLSLGCFL